MLDLSRIDAGLPLRITDTDVAAIAEAQVERAGMLAPRVTDTRTSVEHLVIPADPVRVAQILANLLDKRVGTPRRASGSPCTSSGATTARISPSPTPAGGSPRPTASGCSTAWYGWIRPATATTAALDWGCRSHGRWRGPTVAT